MPLAHRHDAAGGRASSTAARTSTPGPHSSTQGARMKTARIGPPPMARMCRSSSKEST
jgi:hypothetical protein